MRHCPTCGAVMRDDSTTCGECGRPGDADPDDRQAGGPTGDRPDRSLASGHRRQANRSAGWIEDRSGGNGEATQPRDDGSESGGSGSPQAGTSDSPSPGENASGSGGHSVSLDRRTLLFGSGGAIALAGGWVFFLRDDNEAKAVVEEFYRALDQADMERAQSLIHDDGPLGDRFSGPSQSFLEERRFTLELLEEYDRESADDRENVREFVYFGAVITISRTTTSGEEGTDRTAQQVTVAQNPEGEYRIWNL